MRWLQLEDLSRKGVSSVENYPAPLLAFPLKSATLHFLLKGPPCSFEQRNRFCLQVEGDIPSGTEQVSSNQTYIKLNICLIRSEQWISQTIVLTSRIWKSSLIVQTIFGVKSFAYITGLCAFFLSSTLLFLLWQKYKKSNV